MSCRMGKPTICIGENKGADQLRSNFVFAIQPLTIFCDCTACFGSDLVVFFSRTCSNDSVMRGMQTNQTVYGQARS